MGFSALTFALATAGTAMVTLTQRQARDARTTKGLDRLQRDPTGRGLAHLGADGVAGAFDADPNAVDAVAVEPGVASFFRREPGTGVRARPRQARSAPPISRPRSDDGPLARQEAKSKACNTIFCNGDEHCVGQRTYGYDCSHCFFVGDNVGNCMQ